MIIKEYDELINDLMDLLCYMPPETNMSKVIKLLIEKYNIKKQKEFMNEIFKRKDND